LCPLPVVARRVPEELSEVELAKITIARSDSQRRVEDWILRTAKTGNRVIRELIPSIVPESHGANGGVNVVAD